MCHTKRRKFITLIGAAAAWPLASGAQQPERMRRFGELMASAVDDSVNQARMTAFLQGLAHGWTDDRNVRIDTRWPAGSTSTTHPLAPPNSFLARNDKIRLDLGGPPPRRASHPCSISACANLIWIGSPAQFWRIRLSCCRPDRYQSAPVCARPPAVPVIAPVRAPGRA
jgi:hypothetical protein